MGFKSLRLKRSHVFYPTQGNSRDLAGLLNGLTITEDILEDILDLEDDSFAHEKMGAQGYELELLLKKAKKDIALSQEKKIRIYFHMLRRGDVPEKIEKNDYACMVKAYHQLLPFFGKNFAVANFIKYKGLLLFGEYGDIKLCGDMPLSIEDYKNFYKTWNHLNGYSHIPGILSKREKFRIFSENQLIAARVLDILNVTNFRHTDTSQLEAYSVPTLYFWGMVLLVFLNDSMRYRAADSFYQNAKHIPLFAQHLEIMPQFVAATMDEDFVKYVAGLGKSCKF